MTPNEPLEIEYTTLAEAKQAADNCPRDMWNNYRAVYMKPTGEFVFWRSIEGKYEIYPAMRGKWILVAERTMRPGNGWQYAVIPQDAFTQLPPRSQRMLISLRRRADGE